LFIVRLLGFIANAFSGSKFARTTDEGVPLKGTVFAQNR
jgi:hypothetical protein